MEQEQENKQTQVCKRCGRELPIDNFIVANFGRMTTCKECVSKKREESKQKNKEIKDYEEEIKKAKRTRLADFTPRDLMEELSRRGYIGKLSFPQTVYKEVDISKLND